MLSLFLVHYLHLTFYHTLISYIHSFILLYLHLCFPILLIWYIHMHSRIRLFTMVHICISFSQYCISFRSIFSLPFILTIIHIYTCIFLFCRFLFVSFFFHTLKYIYIFPSRSYSYNSISIWKWGLNRYCICSMSLSILLNNCTISVSFICIHYIGSRPVKCHPYCLFRITPWPYNIRLSWNVNALWSVTISSSWLKKNSLIIILMCCR